MLLKMLSDFEGIDVFRFLGVDKNTIHSKKSHSLSQPQTKPTPYTSHRPLPHSPPHLSHRSLSPRSPSSFSSTTAPCPPIRWLQKLFFCLLLSIAFHSLLILWSSSPPPLSLPSSLQANSLHLQESAPAAPYLGSRPPSPVDPSFVGDPLWFKKHSLFSPPSSPGASFPSLSPSASSFAKTKGTATQAVVILGMHRSGTSLLAGLLHHSLHLPVGPEASLLGPAYDNKKGFFENTNVVLQNNDLLSTQRKDFGNADDFDAVEAAATVLSLSSPSSNPPFPTFDFKDGTKALLLYKTLPVFLQKDPRMCLTLPSWFPLLSSPPAIILTTRNPLSVAKSMHNREPSFSMARVLRLWVLYNMGAVKAAEGLCTVHTTAERVRGGEEEEKRVGEGREREREWDPQPTPPREGFSECPPLSFS